MAEIYKVEIGFSEKRHCLECPLRDKEYDSCRLQTIGDDIMLEFDSWESQMLGCPLRFDREVEC